MTRKESRQRRDEGVAAVELAILLPVFLALTLAAIDFALAFRQQIMLRNAASNAAAYAAVQPCDVSGVQDRASQELNGVTVLKPDISVPPPKYVGGSGTCLTATQVQVTVSAPYNLITGSFLGTFGVPQTLT